MMKPMNRLFYITLAFALVAGCAPEVSPIVHTAPEAVFPSGSDFVSASVGETVRFEAEVTKGDNLTVGWYVDDVLECSSEVFEYVFKAPGSYVVLFKVSNGAGSVEKEYTVEIADVLRMSLSTADSTSIERMKGEYLKVMAIVESGVGVRHQWKVDGEVMSDKAYFDSFLIPEVRNYTVSYEGSNAVGSFEKSFTLVAVPRPLEVEFTNMDDVISAKDGSMLTITAEAVSSGEGIVHTWIFDDEVTSSSATFSKMMIKGSHKLVYNAVNAKGETFAKEWLIEVEGAGFLLDDFEGVEALGVIWKTGENTPGVQIVDNPKKTELNMSDKVMSDEVTGTHSTSGYFTLQTSLILETTKVDVTRCSKMRFKVYLGKNRYYPRVHIGNTKYPPVTPPKFNDEWEYLEYHFPSRLSATTIIQIRPLLKEDGSNIDAGEISPTNTRTVYLDDFEFIE